MQKCIICHRNILENQKTVEGIKPNKPLQKGIMHFQCYVGAKKATIWSIIFLILFFIGIILISIWASLMNDLSNDVSIILLSFGIICTFSGIVSSLLIYTFKMRKVKRNEIPIYD